MQHAARPPRQAGQGRRARRRRVPDRVRDDRGVRRHLDGPRGHARLARVARDHRRLGRVRDARRALRRAGHVRRLRQEPARHADGRGADQPPVGLPLRRLDPARPLQGPGARHRERVRGRRRVRGGDDHRERARRDREPRLPDRGIVRGNVHREHDGVGERGDRHGAARSASRARRRPPPRRLRVRVGPRGDAAARARPPARARS